MHLKIILIAVLALLGANATSARNIADWNSVQLVNAYASENPGNSELTIQFVVYDVVGEGFGNVNKSSVGFGVTRDDGSTVDFKLCVNGETLGDFLPVNFFGSSVVRHGFESTVSLSECDNDFAVPDDLPVTLSLYCPPGSITHSDSDAMVKTTFPDGSHRFETVKKSEYEGYMDEPTSMCTVTYSSAVNLVQLPVYWLQIEDSRSRSM